MPAFELAGDGLGPARPSISRVRVLSWNVWWRFGPWWSRQPGIARVIGDSGADLIGLQEVWVEQDGANQAAVLAAKLGFHHATGPLHFRDGLAFTNAILSRWPLADVVSTALPDATGDDGHRRVLAATVRAPFGPVPFFTTHLDWQFDASAVRQAQVAALARLVEARIGAEPPFPAVVTGDFNALPGADEIRSLTGEAPPPVAGLVFTDSWPAAGRSDPGWTFASSNAHLANATWPNRRIDYVFVSWPRPKPLGSVTGCELVGTEATGGVFPSDHYGVLADLCTS